MKKSTNLKNESIDGLVVKCVMKEMAKNPISFIPIINEIVSGNNPDSRVIVKNISDGLTKCAISQKELVNSVYNRIIEMIDNITTQEVIKIVNEQRISLSEDSKKFLEEVARSTMVDLCEKYFESKRKQIDEMFDDYFKSINAYIKEELDKTAKKCKKEAKKSVDKDKVTLDIPSNIQKDVVQYIKFLQSKN